MFFVLFALFFYFAEFTFFRVLGSVTLLFLVGVTSTRPAQKSKFCFIKLIIMVLALVPEVLLAVSLSNPALVPKVLSPSKDSVPVSTPVQTLVLALQP